MKLWLNGNIVDEEEAVIPASDHGFLYGVGLFETLRTYGGEPFLLDRHLNRLACGCRTLRIAYTPDEKALRKAMYDLIAANDITEAYIRLSISAGPAPLGLPGQEGYTKPNLVMYAKELPKRNPDPSAQSKALARLDIARNTPEIGGRLKSFQYMNNIFAKWELLSRPETADAEGCFLNEDGFIAEGTVSNIFFVKEGILHTPVLEAGGLPGVTRGYVMELAKEFGIDVKEGWYRWEHLSQADEIFYTNSVQEIVPVTALIGGNGQAEAVNGGKPGALTLQLYSLYGK